MTIHEITGECSNQAHIGHEGDTTRHVIRVPLDAPYGTTEYVEIHIGNVQGFAHTLLELHEQYQTKAANK